MSLFLHLSRLLCLPVLAIVHLYCPPSSHSFTVPEKFEFSLKWQGIPAGNSVLEVMEEGKFLKIVSTVQSSAFVSRIYRVEDRVETKLEKSEEGKSFGRPLSYRMKILEGWHQRDREVIFDHSSGKVLYKDFLNNETRHYDVSDGILDPLSALFSVRDMPLVVGKSDYVDIFDSKKTWHVEIKVLRKERVRTPAGVFDTVVIQPLLQSEGIFPSRRGEMIIWFSDDDRRIPVKVWMKVVVGSLTVTLDGGKF